MFTVRYVRCGKEKVHTYGSIENANTVSMDAIAKGMTNVSIERNNK
jgi:hypothetical protein